jgi:hypothetical protein
MDEEMDDFDGDNEDNNDQKMNDDEDKPELPK